MVPCRWWRGNHDWHWGPMKWINRQAVQYGTCSRCGKVRVREVLLE